MIVSKIFLFVNSFPLSVYLWMRSARLRIPVLSLINLRFWSFSPLIVTLSGGEGGIRTLEEALTPYTISNRALSTAQSPLRLFLLWRTQLQPIRTAAEITAHIKILPVHQPYLYQKLSQKATQLRLLGMTYEQIAKTLNINRKTATRACKDERR